MSMHDLPFPKVLLSHAILAATLGGTLVLAGCVSDGSDGSDGSNGTVGDIYSSLIDFKALPAAVTDSEKDSIRATDTVTIAGEEQSIAYHTLLKTGDANNGEVYGALKDYQDNTIMDGAVPALCNGTQLPSRSGNPEGSGLDHVSILQKNGKIYQVSQFECQVGAMYMNELSQDAATGELTVVANSMKFVSQKDGFGGYVHCAGTTTPWESHLGSEEYEPNAALLNVGTGSIDPYYDAIADYWGGDLTKSNPYYYGWTPEVSIDASGNPVYSKHYAMGRAAHELAYVMPDKKTVYMSDDGTNGALYMFVADTAEDLSAGQLYAAKWNQVNDNGAGQATLTWIDLGHSTDATISALLNPDNNVTTNDGITFADIFDSEVPADEVNGICTTAGYVFTNTATGRECLSLKNVDGAGTAGDAGDIALASRLETRRMAAYLGATTEFSKMEGITFNARDGKMYMAMSRIYRGMTSGSDGKDDKYDYGNGSGDHIQLTENKCGAVYEMPVAGNNTIGSDYVAYSMKGLVAGKNVDYTGTALVGNTCDIDGISEPDNVAFLEDSNLLLIGEDTGNHLNDMVWAYNIANDKLTRIVTTQYGSETTNPYFYRDINGFGYITLTSQHPFGEIDSGSDTVTGEPYYSGGKTSLPTDEDSLKTQTGYIGPFDFSKVK